MGHRKAFDYRTLVVNLPGFVNLAKQFPVCFLLPKCEERFPSKRIAAKPPAETSSGAKKRAGLKERWALPEHGGEKAILERAVAGKAPLTPAVKPRSLITDVKRGGERARMNSGVPWPPLWGGFARPGLLPADSSARPSTTRPGERVRRRHLTDDLEHRGSDLGARCGVDSVPPDWLARGRGGCGLPLLEVGRLLH